MKQEFPEIVANRALCRRFAQDILAKKLSHAYILEGARGSGKHTVALQIAAAVACEQTHDPSAPLPCASCPSCRKILEKNSPDVIYIHRGDKATLGVDTVRDLRRDVMIYPNDISTKIYIIEDAHLMTPQAQNALLLTLEEPPPYVLFLLLCESAASLLETVRSRAPVLRTEPLSIEAIDRYLTQASADAATLKKSDPREYGEILACSNHTIGQALELLNPKRRKPILANRACAREFITLCAARKSSAAVMRFLNTLGTKRDDLIPRLQAILYCLRDLLVLKQSESAPLCFFSDREEAASLAYEFTTPELLSLCDRLQDTVDALQSNANVRLTMTAFAVNAGLL